MARETMEERLQTLGEKATKLRDKGMKWHEISGDLGVSQGKVLLAHMYVQNEATRIKFKNDDDLAAKIVKARDGGDSWGKISARAGVPESKVRKLWEGVTGKSSSGERVGKGGRHPGESNGTKAPAAKTAKTAKPVTKAAAKAAAAKAAAATKKAPAKKAPAKKAAGGSGGGKLDLVLGGDTDTLAEVMEGKTIMVENSKTGKPETYKVKTVKSSNENNIEIIDAKNGSTRTFKRTAIKRVSK